MTARSRSPGWRLVGWKYRLVSAVSVVTLSVVAVHVAAELGGRLGFGTESPTPGGTTAVVLAVTIALWPLYESRPWRPLDRVTCIASRVAVAFAVVAMLGYGGVGTVPSPLTLAITGVLVAGSASVLAPALRRREGIDRALVVGDDPEKIETTVDELGARGIGYLSPSPVRASPQESGAASVPQRADSTGDLVTIGSQPDVEGEPAPDGGESMTGDGEPAPGAPNGSITDSDARSSHDVPRLANLSRLEGELVERDVDTVALAFRDAGRETFFGALRACRDLGVDVRVHESHADTVLTEDDRAERDGCLVGVDLEPWPWYSRLAKRTFDVCFAVVGLIVLLPLIVAIVLVIKLDSPGPIFYEQRRTAKLGGTFRLLKFRSMEVGAEEESGARLSDEDRRNVDPRVTRVGHVLRKTHMDEIPQLLSILTGVMSVVGPRPERPSLDRTIRTSGLDWEQRWGVKPGLTGLAQINNVTGFDPSEKLEHDLAYIGRRSFVLDLRIVLVEICHVVRDVIALARERGDRRSDPP